MVTTEVVPLSKLKLHPDNPRIIKDAKYHKLVQSLKDFPEMIYARELVVNEEGLILGGNQRFKAAKDAGLKEVPIKRVDWPEDKQKEFMAKDNIGYGEWDWEKLAEQWDGEELDAWGLDLPENWGQDDEDETDPEDDAPEVDTEAPAISQPGTLYELGPHRLFCGDSTSKSDVAKLMQGQKSAMVLTDPPYNIDYTGNMKQNIDGKKRQGIKNDKMTGAEFSLFLEKVCKNLVSNTTGGIYIFMSPHELGTLKAAFEKSGGHWTNTIIWLKNHFTMSGGDYKNIYEPIIYGWPKDITRHYFAGEGGAKNVWEPASKYGVRYVEEYTTITVGQYRIKMKGEVKEVEVADAQNIDDLWRYKRPSRSADHPTMKPLELCREAITNSSIRGQIVLDLFGGSGSTLIASEQTNRKCFMMELDPKYCDVIRKRYARTVEPDTWETEWETITPEIQQA